MTTARQRDIGWRTIEEAEGSGISLIGAYLNYSGSSPNPYKSHIDAWGRLYGRAVYAAWPKDVDMHEFVEKKCAEAGIP